MPLRYLVGITFIIIVTLILSLMVRLGSFRTVEVIEADVCPCRLVSKTHVGPYHEIVPVLEEVEKWVKANGETCQQSFGEYIDDPDQVAEDRLRSNGGCIVDKDWSKGLPEGFTYREIAKMHVVKAEFDGAPSIGPIKVYPRAKQFIEAHDLKQAGPTYEIYEILSPQAVRTTYYFPVSKH